MAQIITAGEVITIHNAGAGHVVDSVVVTGLVGGGYAVAWKENISGGSYIVTARLDADDDFIDLDGTTAGDFRIVNPDTVPSSPAISGTSDGGFVVGFYDRSPYVARFDAASFTTLDVIPHDPNGINFYVQTSPVVAGLDGGGYVAAYTGEYNGAADGFDGPIVPIARTSLSSLGNTDISEAALLAKVADLDGGYVLAYSDTVSGTGFVKARIISSNAPVDITVNQTASQFTTLNGNSTASVAELSNGNFVVIWGGGSTSQQKVFARVFEPDGDAVTDELWVDGNTATDWPISVVGLKGGGFAVLWVGTSSAGIQVYDNAGNKVGDPFWDFGGTDGGIIRSMTQLESGELLVSYQGGTMGFAEVQRFTVNPLTVGEPPTDITGKLKWTEGTKGIIGTLKAVDADDTTGFTWSLLDDAGGRFKIDAATGKVSVAKPLLLDFEQAKTHALTVKITDNDGNSFNKVLTAKGTDVAMEDLAGSSSADKLFGGSNADRFSGGKGDDTLKGGGGKDVLDGGKGKDTADYSDKAKSVEVTLNKSTAVTVEVDGKAEDSIKNVESIIGGSKADTLTGDGASNTFYGRLGKDALEGKGGKDFFVFDSALGKKHADTIADFKPKDDTILLDRAVFASLGVGALSADAFVTNATGEAADDTDRIVYNSSNGKLFYDVDGLGGTAGILFATLVAKPALTAADFEVV